MHVNPLVYLLVALFGSSSWLSTNAVWMELSLLTQDLPEKWNLPSYLALIVQIACVGPLIYSIFHKCTKFEVHSPYVILALLVLCTSAQFALAFCWDTTAYIFGAQRSVALFGIMFILALVNSTSNVLFMPFMATYHSSYLTAYFVGMGLSSLVPSVGSLVQGTSQYECVYNNVTKAVVPIFTPARFHVTSYTFAMGIWMFLTLISFTLLHFFHDYFAQLGRDDGEPRECSPLKGTNEEPTEPTTTTSVEESEEGSLKRFVILSVCLAFVCAQMNAVVPSVQSYATMSYSQLTYHLALALSALAHPVASFLPMWVHPKTLKQLVSLTVIATAFCSIIVILALQSPEPLFRKEISGSILVIVVSVITALLHSYIRTVITTVMREDAPNNESRLFWCGVFMQVGSFLGSVVIFPLVNLVNLFQSAPLCRA